MSLTAHLQLHQAVVAALQAAPALAGVPVYSNPVRELPAQVASAVVVTLRRSAAQRPTLHAMDWATTLQIDCMARAPSATADAAAAVDPMVHAAWATLAALNATALGLMDVQPDPSITWDFAEGATPHVAATLLLNAVHRTPATHLSPWP